MDTTFALSAVMLGLLAWTLPRAKRRLELSRAKHASLAGHSRMARAAMRWPARMPASSAIWPYVATLPRGMARTTA